eukprot:2457716-Heterocapsa_arctica.AAC.1
MWNATHDRFRPEGRVAVAVLPMAKVVGGNRHGLDAAGALLYGDGGSFPPGGSLFKTDEPESEVPRKAGAGEGVWANVGQGG